jgi:predicted site-specific integrase-resolvase
MNTYKPQDFSEMIGVSVKTLQRWDNDGKLKAYLTPTDRRYYTHKQLLDFTQGDEEIAKELQNGNKSNKRTETNNS